MRRRGSPDLRLMERPHFNARRARLAAAILEGERGMRLVHYDDRGLHTRGGRKTCDVAGGPPSYCVSVMPRSDGYREWTLLEIGSHPIT